MLLIKIYLYHLYFRIIWLKDLFSRGRINEQHSINQANLMVRSFPELSAQISFREMMCNQEFKIYSQNGEDGILIYIFSQIGTTNKTFIEFGIETGKECNTAALIRYFGWNGLLMDGGRSNIRKATDYYSDRDVYRHAQLKISQCFVTTDNINQVIKEHEITGEIDLLSIDIDGNDYWIWETINVVNPRVVVIEYNASFGSERLITVPYDPSFQRFNKHKSGWYHGASIAALTHLARLKNYRLVCADSKGCNVFFVRDDVWQGQLQEQTPAQAFYPQPKRNLIASLEQQFRLIKNLDYVEIK